MARDFLTQPNCPDGYGDPGPERTYPESQRDALIPDHMKAGIAKRQAFLAKQRAAAERKEAAE